MAVIDVHSEPDRDLTTFVVVGVLSTAEILQAIQVEYAGAPTGKVLWDQQAVDYACNQGCEWVALTNGQHWQVYQVSFGKPIEATLVLSLNLLALNHRKDEDVAPLALLSREAWQKSSLEDFAVQKQALSRFTIAAVVLSDPVLQVIRREVRRISADVKVDLEAIQGVLAQEVIKREVIEGDKAEAQPSRKSPSAHR
jgi:predicted type IV restriction endonuclease